ncbi:hypothetical protein BDW74DRAFT_109004 [Aspergillus multicolor]|uniref:uncharacterized protein n=1 Tax=Aspergillus multicolor TaxID=41759 RepID=UPI003CCCE478
MSDFQTQRTVTNIIADVVQIPKNRVHPGLEFGSAHLKPTDDQLDEIRRRLIDVYHFDIPSESTGLWNTVYLVDFARCSGLPFAALPYTTSTSAPPVSSCLFCLYLAILYCIASSAVMALFRPF